MSSTLPLAPASSPGPSALTYHATQFGFRQASSSRSRLSLPPFATAQLAPMVLAVFLRLQTLWTRTCAKPFEVAPFRIRMLAVSLVLAGLVVSVLLFIRLREAPSHNETQLHCNRRASQLQNIFDVQAISLVRHLSAYLSAIGATSIPAFTEFVGLLRPDNTTVSAVTLYQRVEQRQRAQWVADYAQELKPGNRNDIWTLPAVTVRPVHVAEMWPCIASIPISDTAIEAGKVFPFIGFDPLGEPTRAAPLLRALRPETFGKPSMSSLIRYPSDGSLGFNIYARNLRPVKTQSSVTDEVAIGAHFVVRI
ncbi:hypothetical protein BCR44DRAFT_297247 [Catenaria anguillulae PL171]|uniref:Uncharacterized protein n=1 Tax=Catenaria anguillulae PL171 TaxID=765915 RepID=A0A1Y2HN02_9FUNG|nr:hypothetical protein BCR44DRAFT_297247 [Catenaria anguillulae PL171]